MTRGKKEAHLQRALEHPEILKLEEARETLKANYVCTINNLAKILNYPVSGHRYIADVYYALIEKEGLRLCDLQLPEPVSIMTLKQHNWYLRLIQKAENWNDFCLNFLTQFKEQGVRKSAANYNIVLEYVQKANIRTNVFRQDWTKNRFGYSTEVVLREYLQEMKLPYEEQKRLKDAKGRLYIPDFVIANQLIVEVNGDYWHGFGKRLEELDDRIQKRVLQDFQKYDFYRSQNYNFLIIWEHELKNKAIIIKKLKENLDNANNYQRIT